MGIGRSATLCTEFDVPFLGPICSVVAELAEPFIALSCELTGSLRMRIVRMPSRERKRMVDSKSSSCMLARPKMLGDTSRTRS